MEKEKQTQRELQRELEQAESGLHSSRREFPSSTHIRFWRVEIITISVICCCIAKMHIFFFIAFTSNEPMNPTFLHLHIFIF